MVRVGCLGGWLANLPDFALNTPTLDGQVQIDVQIGDTLLVTGGGNIRHTTLESDMVIPSALTELRGAGFVHAQWSPWVWLSKTKTVRHLFS